MRLAIFAAAALAIAAPAAAAPADDLHRLMDEHYRWLLRENPTDASALGMRDYDGRIRDISPAARDRRAREAQAFLGRLQRDPGRRAAAAGSRQPRHPDPPALRADRGQWLRPARHAVLHLLWLAPGLRRICRAACRSTRRADFDSYLTRIAQYPQLNDQALAITANAVRGGYVLPCSVLHGYERTISGVIAADPTQSRYLRAVRAAAARPPIGEADWAALQARARTIIATIVNPAYQKHLDFYLHDYLPHCARSDSVSAQPRGAEYYALQVREHTTTNLTPQQIHDIGLREVAPHPRRDGAGRARGRLSEPRGLHPAPRTDPLLFPDQRRAARRGLGARSTRRWIIGCRACSAGCPRLTFTIREIPAETAEGTTTAYYSQGSPESGIAGTYYVNISHLDQRPLWEIPALSLHESVPGHHLQIALQQEMELAPFRRNFTAYTAFTEGWALYAESLGEEMGVYNTPERQMGELSYQMWRACRLVVDTGIHAFGWDKARAIQYMRDNTALTDQNIEAEVNRYISWPGQALGYMIGRLKIIELRHRAEAALGPRFDIRRFHDAVLRNGSVPLDVLESEIDAWIAAERARS